jgi:hypothetical protein
VVPGICEQKKRKQKRRVEQVEEIENTERVQTIELFPKVKSKGSSTA